MLANVRAALAPRLPEPWWELTSTTPTEIDVRDACARELQLEIAPEHVMARRAVRVVAKCQACDEVLVELDGGEFALVHLTWRGSEEPPPWPTVQEIGPESVVYAAATVHECVFG